jgi:hypothetical protein
MRQLTALRVWVTISWWDLRRAARWRVQAQLAGGSVQRLL